MKKPAKSIFEAPTVVVNELSTFNEREGEIPFVPYNAYRMSRDVVMRHLREFESITLRHKLFDTITMHFNISMDGYAIEMHIDARVPDRETGQMTPLHAQYAWTVSELEHQRGRNGMDFKLHIVRFELRKFLEHELDEMLCYNGKQLKDPHLPERYNSAP